VIKLLTDLLLSVVSLVEAEARSLQQAIVHTVTSVFVILFAFALLLGGLGLLVACAVMSIQVVLGPKVALLLVGGGVLIGGFLVLAVASSLGRH